MSEGWISLHRKIEECWLWLDEPFSKGQAWVDLLLLANHRDKKISFNGEIITIKKGARITSIKSLAERWQWSRHKVSDFLNILERDGMITQNRDNKRTLITIVNYGVYQLSAEDEGHQKDIKRTSKGHQKDTNNNDNNENNENKREAHFTPPTYDEVKTFVKENGYTINPQTFFNHYTSNGWMKGQTKMTDWQAAIRTWQARQDEEAPKKDKFNNFSQREDFDWDEYERKLLAKQ